MIFFLFLSSTVAGAHAKYIKFEVTLKNILISVSHTSKEINIPQLFFYIYYFFFKLALKKVKNYCKVGIIGKKIIRRF